MAQAAVSRRPPISLSRFVARTHMYTYAAKVWDLSIVQGFIFCRPVPNATSPIRNSYHRCALPALPAWFNCHLPSRYPA
jgi:hypothetical protein